MCGKKIVDDVKVGRSAEPTMTSVERWPQRTTTSSPAMQTTRRNVMDSTAKSQAGR